MNYNYENEQYSAQQKRLLRKAEEQGLDITYLLNPRFTYEQMEILYNALLYDIDIKDYAKPSISSNDMKALIQNDKERKKSYKIAKKSHQITSLKLLLIIIVIISLISGVGIMLYANRSNIAKLLNPPILELKENEIYYTLSSGTFDPYHYLKQTPTKDKLQVQGVDEVYKMGKHQITYSATNGIRNTEQILIVHTVDDVAPIIELSASKISLSENDNFSPKEYIKKCNDNIDGDLTSKVTISNFDLNLDSQSIIYRVEDTSGNVAEQTLIITKDKVPEKEIVYVTESGNHSAGSSQSSSTSNSVTSSNNATNGKFYSINDYSSFDECLNVCMKDLGGMAGSCIPEQNNDGEWTGYRMHIN